MILQYLGGLTDDVDNILLRGQSKENERERERSLKSRFQPFFSFFFAFSFMCVRRTHEI